MISGDNPALPQPRRSRALRPVLLIVVLAVLTVLGAVILARFIYPQESEPSMFLAAGELGRFSPGTVKTLRHPASRVHVVRMADGTVLALSAEHPHPQGCTVEWRPNLQIAGQVGWFRDPCLVASWDMSGRHVYGPSPRDLDRYEVRIVDGQVVVDATRIIRGEASGGSGDRTPPPIVPR